MADYTLEHTYVRGCPEVIAQVTAGEQRAMALIELTGCPEEIIAVVQRDPTDSTGMTALLIWDNAGEGTVSIRWDAGALYTGQPESGQMSQAYAPGDEGVHTVTVTDESDANRSITVTFELPLAENLDITVSPDDSDPTGMTALAVWGPTEPPTPPGELDIIITADSGDSTGMTATATWTETGGTP